MAAKSKIKNPNQRDVTIGAPNLQVAEFCIRGTAPYVQSKFGATARKEMRDKQAKGSTAKKGKKKAPKDFDRCYAEAQRISRDGWHGFPAPGLRRALIDACRVTGFAMTMAKMSVFVQADGFDDDDGMPLVRFTKGDPEYSEMLVSNAKGTDIRARPMWREGWEAVVRLRFDADQFTVSDVANLLMRAGQQVGIGCGRPFSPNSSGLDWGTFEIVND